MEREVRHSGWRGGWRAQTEVWVLLIQHCLHISCWISCYRLSSAGCRGCKAAPVLLRILPLGCAWTLGTHSALSVPTAPQPHQDSHYRQQAPQSSLHNRRLVSECVCVCEKNPSQRSGKFVLKTQVVVAGAHIGLIAPVKARRG